MRIAIAYDAAAAAGGRETLDVLDQIDAVASALDGLGHQTFRLPLSGDFIAFRNGLAALAPDLVFNLVESINNSDRLQTVFAMFLEDWGIPFTGCSSRAMFLSNHKAAAKAVMAAAGIPFPPCFWLDGPGGKPRLQTAPGWEDPFAPGCPWIVKALESHASIFLDEGSVMELPDADAAARILADKRRLHGVDFFAEIFIDGREFNLSLVENPDLVPEVLPAAEIRFAGFPPGAPRIVGYDAKWLENSRNYAGTPRSFAIAAADWRLPARLGGIALDCWEAFSLSGYARVDFRVDKLGRPFVLEVNANPALTPDAGLAAAAGEKGWRYQELCHRIVAAAAKRHSIKTL